MAAVDRLSDHLNNVGDLIDYGARRDALTTWTIPLNEWGRLNAGLRESHLPRGSRQPGKPFVDWGDSKRILASIWIWVRIPQG
jgi:hypothetical protein